MLPTLLIPSVPTPRLRTVFSKASGLEPTFSNTQLSSFVLWKADDSNLLSGHCHYPHWGSRALTQNATLYRIRVRNRPIFQHYRSLDLFYVWLLPTCPHKPDILMIEIAIVLGSGGTRF